MPSSSSFDDDDDAERPHPTLAARPFMAKRGRRNNLNVKIYYPLLLLCYLEVRKMRKTRERVQEMKTKEPDVFFLLTSTSTRGGVAEF